MEGKKKAVEALEENCSGGASSKEVLSLLEARLHTTLDLFGFMARTVNVVDGNRNGVMDFAAVKVAVETIVRLLKLESLGLTVHLG